MQSLPISPLQKLFNEATQKVLNDKWKSFYFPESHQGQTRNAERCILPYPDSETLPKLRPLRFATDGIFSNPTEHERRLTWMNWAAAFINNNRTRVGDNLRHMERHLTAELAAWNGDKKEKNKQLQFDDMWREWLKSVENKSLNEFTGLYIHAGTARQFLTPKFEQIKERYTIPTKIKGRSDNVSAMFDNYIVEQHRNKLMPYLISNYAGNTPGGYGFMLYALVEAGCIVSSTLNGNQSALHRALINTFGEIGSRQALNIALNRLDPKEIHDEDKRQITVHKQRIVDFLKSEKPY